MILGIDPDTYKLTVAGIEAEPRENEVPYFWEIPIRKDAGWLAMLLALRELEPALVESEVPWKEVSMIWVERAWGASRSSDYLMGCIVGALFATLPIICDAEVNPIGLGEWRKELTGKYPCNKAMAESALRQREDIAVPIVLNNDEIDALGVVVAGRQMNLKAAGIIQ